MNTFFSKLLDKISSALEEQKGLLPLIGILFIVLNYILQFSTSNWISESNLFLHLGIIVAILGFMLAWAL